VKQLNTDKYSVFSSVPGFPKLTKNEDGNGLMYELEPLKAAITVADKKSKHTTKKE
jgi:hypothetical protein